MSDLDNFQQEDNFETRLASKYTAGATTLTVQSSVTFTFSRPFYISVEPGSNNYEPMLVTAISGTTWTVTGAQPRYTGDSGSAKTHPSGSKVIVSNNQAGFSDIRTAINSKLDDTGGTMSGKLQFSGTTHAGVQLISLTTTERLALTPVNGDMVYDETLGQAWQYVGGAWGSVDTGTATSNSTESSSGSTELGTVAEQGTATASGSAGPLVPQVKNLVKTSSGAGDENKIAVLDSSGQFAAGFLAAAGATSLTAGENLTAEDSLHVEDDGNVWKTVKSATSFVNTGMGADTTPTSMRALYLSDNKVVNIYTGGGSTVYGKVIDVTRNTSVTGGTQTSLATTAQFPVAAVIGANKVVVTYYSTSDTKLYGVVFTVSGNTITAGTPVKLYDTETIVGSSYSVCKLDTDKFLVCARNVTSNDPIAIACTVSGTTITAGSAVAAEATTMAGATECAQIDTDLALIIYDDGTNVSARTLSVSGTTITYRAAAKGLYVGLLRVNDLERFLYKYGNRQFALFSTIADGGTRVSQIGVGNNNVASTAISHIEEQDFLMPLEFSAGNSYISQINDDRFCFMGGNTNELVNVLFFKLLNGAIEILSSFYNIAGNVSGAATGCIAPLHSTQLKALILETEGGTDVEWSVAWDTSEEFIGMAKTTVSAAASVVIEPRGNIAQTGLTAGQAYYVGDAGAVATTGSRRIGVATTTTNLFV